MLKKVFLILAAAVLFSLQMDNHLSFAQSTQNSGQKIENGKSVSIEYRVRLADGTVADSNIGKAPLTYVHGKGQIIPGLEKQLAGLKAGDARKIEVNPKEAYGEFDATAVQEIPKSAIDGKDLVIGGKLYSQDSNGGMITATVKEIKKDSVVIDYNHPLAGKALYFDVKILNVK